MRCLLKDRFFLLCVVTSAVIMISSSFVSYDVSDGNIGIVHDVSSSSSGYVFIFDDSSGNSFKCFFKERPYDNSICSIEGTYSDEGSIFFVSSLIVIC